MSNNLQFFKRLKSITKEELLSIGGIGDKIANNFVEYFASPYFITLQEKLLNSKIEIINSANINSQPLNPNGRYYNQTICITGTFDIPRVEIAKIIEKEGGTVVGSINKSVTLLLAGDKAGSKIKKAQTLGIKILENY